MPEKINMFIPNGNHMIAQMRSLQQQAQVLAIQSKPKAPPSALNAPIISRIHNVRPGCGSCGRK